MPRPTKAAREQVKAKASQDFYFFCTKILKIPLYEPLHRPVCDFLTIWQPDKDIKLLLLPRRHLKSSLASFALPLWTWINDPTQCIFFAHGTQSMASMYLGQIRRRIESDEMLRALWPEIFFDAPKRESPLWTADEFIIKRPSESDFRTPSIVAAGLGAMKTGMHFSQFLLDDLVYDKESVNSIVTRNNTSDFIDAVDYMGLPGFKKIILGTRWHMDDAYGRLLDPKNGKLPYLDTMVMDCGWPNEPIFPLSKCKKVGFTKKMLDAQYHKNPYEFGCQMMNNPRIEGSQAFKREDIEIFVPNPDGTPPTELELNYFTSVDANRTEWEDIGKTARGADPCAIVTAGIDKNNHIWVVDITTGNPNVFELVEFVFHHVRRWKPKVVFFEAIGYQKQLGPVFKRRMMETGTFFAQQPIERANINKTKRILRMQDRVVAKALHVKYGLSELIDQMVNLGSWRHDDQAEALADIDSHAYPPNAKFAEENAAPRSSRLMNNMMEQILRTNTRHRTAEFG